MSPRRRSPVLLELVDDRGKRSRPRATGPDRPAPVAVKPQPEPDADTEPRFGPGRVIRVPVGYFFFAIAGIIAIFVIGWALGHRQANQQQQHEQARAAEQSLSDINDPVLNGAPSAAPERSPSRVIHPQTRTQTTPKPVAPAPLAILPDLNYLIVALTDPETADEIIAFLRANRLDAIVDPSDTGRFRQVIAMPGFPSGSLSSPEARRLKQEVLRLGRLWKTDQNGYTDFSDSYFKRY